MTPTRTPGTDGAPSTLMGAGWRPRARSHADELGAVWGDFGLRSEVAPLTHVLLTWPGDELAYAESPEDQLMYARPDLARMREEALGVAEAYTARGVAVHWLQPSGVTPGSDKAPPNLVFARDLGFMTPDGVVLARMASEQRAGEERIAAAAFAALGIPILATPTGRATFEGPDALWIARDHVLIGVGRRTNPAGAALVARALADQGVTSEVVSMPTTVQHLLGTLNFLDERLVALRHATPELRAVLDRHGYAAIDLSAEPELAEEASRGRAHNFVAMAPRVVLMPAGNPRTRARLEALGVTVVERDVSQYLCAAGGIGCLTGVLGRRG